MPEHQQVQQSKKPNTSFQKQATPVSQTPVSNPYSIIQRAKINPKSLTHADVMQLQRTIGNQAVGRLLSGIGSTSTAQQATVQRQEIPEEKGEETCPSCMQRQENPAEKEPLQGKFEDKPEIVCPSCFAAPIVQKQESEEKEKPLQGKMIGTIQRQEIPEEKELLQTKKENNTEMPDNLKAGVENLSGIDMSDVSVHYNSDKPAEVGALAYTQGTDIQVALGQERHLPHEAWHVVQQKQGRVQPTMEMKDGISINDDSSLENEANYMGAKAEKLGESTRILTQLVSISNLSQQPLQKEADQLLIQRMVPDHIGLPKPVPKTGTYRAIGGKDLIFDSGTYPRKKFSFGSKTRDEVFMSYNPQTIGNRVISIRSTSGEQVNVAGVQLDHHFSWDNIAQTMTEHNNFMKVNGFNDPSSLYTLWDAKMYYNDQDNLVPALGSLNAAAGAAGVSEVPRIHRGLEIYQGQIQTSWMNLQAGLVAVGGQLSDDAVIEVATLLHNIAQAMNDVTDRLL